MATATATEPGGRRGRIVPAAAAALLGLLLLGKAGGIAVAGHAVRLADPALVEAAAPLSPTAGAAAAELRFAAGDAPGAQARAARAVERDPLSARALRTYGLAREAQGDAAAAARSIALAGGLGWRDTPTQLWLLRAYAAQGDYAAALERADALARRREALPEMMTVFMAAAADPAGRAPLAARLAAGPPWRAAFFEAAHDLPPERAAAYADFLAAFTGAGHALTPAEVEAFATSLFQRGDHAAARAAWARFAAPREAGRLLFDGGFEAASLDPGRHLAPFEWRFRQAPGSETELAAPPGRAGTALLVRSPGNARFEMAAQSAALAPGRYVLSVDAAAAEGAPLEGFSWTVDCVPGGFAPAATRSAAPGAGGWTRLSYAFAVPASGCGAQRVRLILHGLQPRPLELWFDDAAIARAG